MPMRNIFSKVKNILIRIRRKALTEFTIMYLYPILYRVCSRKDTDKDKIIFIESRLDELSNSFHEIHKSLSKNKAFKLKCHFLRKTFVSDIEYTKNCIALIKDMATARCIFMDEATHIFAKIKLRPETELVQLWHGCGAFKKFGYSVSDGRFGASERAKTRYPVHKNYTLVTVSSPKVIPHFEEAMNLKGSGIVRAEGVSRTDIFYDEYFIRASHEKLYSCLPEAKNKKIILYAPTFRGNVESAQAPDKLDISKMRESLSDDYIMIIKHHPLVKDRPSVTDTFAFDFTDKMSIEELLCVSNLCISDYSSLIYEYSLFERPMIFFAYDLDEYFDERGFYYDYNELTPGPVLKTTEEIISYIKTLTDNFDKSKVKAFREKFMSSCDGHATERILQKIFADEYNGKSL